MPKDKGKPSKPPPDDPFSVLKDWGDPALRVAAWLIRNKDWPQLEQRTGIRRPGKPFLPVLLQLDPARAKPDIFSTSVHKRYGIPLAYRDALKRNSNLTHMTARLPLDANIFSGSVDSLAKAVMALRARGVSRVCLGAPGQPSRQRASLPDIGLPPDRTYKGKVLTGEGVIVGIIDDGCALAHCDFLKRRTPGAPVQSRIEYLWDQGGPDNPPLPWSPTAGFYGRELNKAAIDGLLNAPANRNGELIRENAVYEQLDYRIGEVAPHGTHVMDIAAGTGQSLTGLEGVAPDADIIFVQLPRDEIEGGATALLRSIVDGVAYIFDRAKALNKPAVVNISYGGYDGPHDGTSELEQALDQMLTEPDCALVISAGNGFEARCHALKKVAGNGVQSLRWIIPPEDPTANDLELWYDNTTTLRVRLTPPSGAIAPAGWLPLGLTSTPITRTSDGKVIGYIEHLPSGTGNGANRISVSLNASDASADSGPNARAPSGMWTVKLKRFSGPPVNVHAWIWRDDAGRARNIRRRQSRFHPNDAHPAHTIAGWATGRRTISVGAYNTATQEICRYSASGPTRPMGGNPGRPKPEAYAPAEEDARGRGVLSASALSANPRRMNGTSASAPHVAGLVALMFEYAQKHASGHPVSLTADQIRTEVEAQAKVKPRFNRHQKVDARVIIKQQDVQAELVPSGKADFTETMKQLPQ